MDLKRKFITVVLLMFLTIFVANILHTMKNSVLHLKNQVSTVKKEIAHLENTINEQKKAAVIVKEKLFVLSDMIKKKSTSRTTLTLTTNAALSSHHLSTTTTKAITTTTTLSFPQRVKLERKKMIDLREKWTPIITNEDKTLFIHLLKVFSEIASQCNYTFFMWGGTLLGSYRHHDIVPWDDDVDILLNETARPAIEEHFAYLKPNYTLQRVGNRYKFYHLNSLPLNDYSWKWPYVDITLFRDNGTHISETAEAYGVALVIQRNIVVPLTKRPFLDMWINAPRDTFACLVWSYGFSDQCRMIGYSHMMEAGDKSGSILCKELAPRYAFVKRSIYNGRMKEELIKGDRVIHTIYTDEPLYALCETYALKLQLGAKLRTDIKWPDKYSKLIKK